MFFWVKENLWVLSIDMKVEEGCSFPTCGFSSSASPETSWSSQLLPSGAKPDNDHLDVGVVEGYYDEGVHLDDDEVEAGYLVRFWEI